MHTGEKTRFQEDNSNAHQLLRGLSLKDGNDVLAVRTWSQQK